MNNPSVVHCPGFQATCATEGPFVGSPALLLLGIDGVKAALADTSWLALPHLGKYRVKSDWLVALIDELLAQSGRTFAYNADVLHAARERLGLPRLPDDEACQEGTPLSLLVYNAQKFRRSDQLRAQGFAPFTQAMVDEAHARKRKIATPDTLLTTREKAGKVYAFQPRRRAYAADVTAGTPAKIV